MTFRTPPHRLLLTILVAAAACTLLLNTSHAATVSTAFGQGADIEMREQTDPTAARVDSPDLNTRWNPAEANPADQRNEVVGLRFDLGNHTLPNLRNVSLNLINYRTNLSRTIDVYGVTPSATGGTGLYSTDTWTDNGPQGVRAWGDLPGLLLSDGIITTASLDESNLTLLVDDFTISRLNEGTVETISSAALTSFVQNHTGSRLITLLITQGGSGSSGQFRFASSEATGLATAGEFAGPAGLFAPYLEFEVVLPRFTNAVLAAEGLVLSGDGGPGDGAYALLAADNLMLPWTNWPAVSTNHFGGDGSFRVTNTIAGGSAERFFRLLTLDRAPDFGLVGFAATGAGTTGGAGGSTQTVSTAADFIAAVGASGPRVVQVDGFIDLSSASGSNASIHSDKTILGLGTNAWISGQLQISGRSNVILRNLSISNNATPSVLDGVRIVNGSHHVWVDHCTFVDCSDGAVDITVGSDDVTVSWCKFSYVNQSEHRFANLIAASDTDAGSYRITFHHNWWSTGCDQRMPMSRYGTVHLFNNHYFAPGNSYCSNARTNAQFLSEHNYYLAVDDPIYKTSNGRIRVVGNIYQNCTGQIDPGVDTLDPVLSPPPYSYALDPTIDVPAVVTHHAGAGRGPFAP